MRERGHLRLVSEQTTRPDLRHQRRRDVVVYRIRVDLDGSEPAIWRRLDVRSNVTLDLLHQALQVAFDWDDAHLHRFSLGGHGFDRHSQWFLCPYDVDNPEWGEDDDGVAAAETRIDETLSEPGDVLNYLYDYGDNWELTLRLEEVLPAGSGTPAAVVVDGERAAPPEDCGHLVFAEQLAEVVPDPALFDLERINRGFGRAFFVLREGGVDDRLVQLVHRLTYTPGGDEVNTAAMTLADPAPGPIDWAANLRAHQWFLDRAADGGIVLTSAGYLKPADVEAASEVVPAMNDWIGKNNRENNSGPLLHFRQSLQSMGLLRKAKGTLSLTKAGEASRLDSAKLVAHLAGRLIPASGDEFDVHVALLLSVYAAASPGRVVNFNGITGHLAELGWRYQDGGAPHAGVLYQSTVWDVLKNVTSEPVTYRQGNLVSPAAAVLARKALGIKG